MARELEEIRLSIVERFVNNATVQSLYGLTPGQTFDSQFSKVSLEALFFHVVSFSILTLEQLFDQHKEWINAKAASMKGGQLPWYVSKAKEFQLGDSLSFIDDEYKYAAVNTANQIIKVASATEVGSSSILLKVANIDSNGDILQLTQVELDAFTAYMKKVKYAGPKLLCVSRPPDLAIVNYHVYVDPQIIAPDGSLISDPSVFPVEDAINTYIKNLPFDGVYSITEQTDIIQDIDGVINPVFESAQSKFGANSYTAINDYYTSNAGYMTIDPANPLSSTITYLNL